MPKTRLPVPSVCYTTLMNFAEYQKESRKTAIYPNAGENFVYPTLGLAGETGEVVEKIKKMMRNDGVVNTEAVSEDKKTELTKEIGDVLWYVAQLCTELDIEMDDCAQMNIEKLQSRQQRGVLHSAGDNR